MYFPLLSALLTSPYPCRKMPKPWRPKWERKFGPRWGKSTSTTRSCMTPSSNGRSNRSSRYTGTCTMRCAGVTWSLWQFVMMALSKKKITLCFFRERSLRLGWRRKNQAICPMSWGLLSGCPQDLWVLHPALHYTTKLFLFELLAQSNCCMKLQERFSCTRCLCNFFLILATFSHLSRQNSHKVPPPWLIAMQRYGPPPSYPNLKIPGLNAPIPEVHTLGKKV